MSGQLTVFVLENKAKLIEDVVGVLELQPPTDDRAFADAVTALTCAGVQSIDLARSAHVAVSTVTRWGQGVSSPHPLGRPRMVAALLSGARKTAAMLRDMAASGKPAPITGHAGEQPSSLAIGA